MNQSTHRRPNLVARFSLVVPGALAVSAATFATPPQPKAGAPLSGLTPSELARFAAGKQRYQQVFQASDGLGPAFNKQGCADCHSNPVGGWGTIKVTRFGFADKGSFDPLTQFGGPLLQSFAISESCQETVSAAANVTTQRVTNSSLAFGLVEAIPDAAILANADPNDVNGDLVSGRARMVESVESPGVIRVGRFGWKAQVATVLTFSADAAVNEVGITNRFFPEENAPNGDASLLAQCDGVADPEDAPDGQGFEFIDRVTDFQRFLGPPPQTPKSGMTGETIFNSIGCAKCHIAQWQTAGSPTLESAIRNRTIRPYSDFLLHDMGLLGDGIVDGDASDLEMRTPTLWNLRTRDPMLHDGRVSGGTLASRVAGPGGAIAWHNVIGSEAKSSAAAFFALSATDQARVVAFLDSLGRLEFDSDGDGTIGYVDFLGFQACWQHVGVTADDACAVHDVDQSGTIDAADFAVFLAQYEGPNGDCDNDGVSDLEEILLGAPDADQNGVPDACRVCAGDLNGNGTVDAADLGILLGAWGTPSADLTGDGTTGGPDLGVLLGAWGACP